MGYRRPELLSTNHVLDCFDCGKPVLNDWLLKSALYNHSEGFTRTTVIADESMAVVGYYALCAGTIHRSQVTRNVHKGRAPAEIPVTLLARLAVSKEHQGQRLGAHLLRHALVSTMASAERVASRGVLVHALDDDAVRFYRRFDFQPTKEDALRLILPVAKIAASIAAAAER